MWNYWLGKAAAVGIGFVTIAVGMFLLGSICRIMYEAFMLPWMVGS